VLNHHATAEVLGDALALYLTRRNPSRWSDTQTVTVMAGDREYTLTAYVIDETAKRAAYDRATHRVSMSPANAADRDAELTARAAAADAAELERQRAETDARRTAMRARAWPSARGV